MGLLDKVIRKMGYASVGEIEAASWERMPQRKDVDLGKTYSTADSALASFFSQASYTGKTVNESSAMQISAVFTCARILSETYGQLPLCVYEEQADGSLIEVEDHPLEEIFEESPNADMTGVEYKEAQELNLVLGGNTYSLKNLRGNGDISSLYPLVSANVLPKQRDDGTIFYSVNDRGKWHDVPRENIWHVKGFGDNGLMGYSPISYMRQLYGVSLATEEFQARFFANGANPSWIITIPEWLDGDQRIIARENLQMLLGGASNAHKVHLLEGGMKAEAATMPLEDAQFLELRKLSRDDIFGIYRIPPHMGGVLDKATNNNIEQQALEFISYALIPYLKRYEASIKKWLFKPGDRKLCPRFNVDELLRADAKTRADLYAKFVQNGIMDRAEVRARERLPQRAGDTSSLEMLTVQSNLVPLDMLRDVAEKLSQPQAGGISGDPTENADPNNPSDDPPPKAAPSILVLNQLRLPDSTLKLDVHQPDIKVVAENNIPAAPALTVQAPNVNVHPNIDLREVAVSLGKFAEAAERMAEGMEMDTVPIKDADGTLIGARKVRRIKET